MLNFGYILYLYLRENNYSPNRIESDVRKWHVLSILTDRYSSNPEGAFGIDMGRIQENGRDNYMKAAEEAELSDALCAFGLPQRLSVAVSTNPF